MRGFAIAMDGAIIAAIIDVAVTVFWGGAAFEAVVAVAAAVRLCHETVQR